MTFAHRYLTGLLALCAATAVLAQQGRPSEEQIAKWRAMREASGGEVSRPPEGASPEERRAFYQKRAAERAQAEATAAPAAVATAKPAEDAHAGHGGGAKSGAKPPSAVPVVAAKPDDAPRGGPRPGSGGMSGMGGMPMRGGGALWLSDSPPMRGDGQISGRGGMGGMPMAGERSGPPVKRLWLRAGNDPQKSGFAREDAEAPPEILLVSPQGKPEGEALPPAEDGSRKLSFPMPAQGFYRLYLTTRKLQGDTLAVTVAKAEVANFSHGADEEERAKGLIADRVLESAPLEIVRERKADEKPFFQLRSGEEQGYLVLQKGLPVHGARVRFVSHQGWSKEVVSDEQGRVVFQIIRDYFPPWDDFQKRFKASYLLIADVSAAESGKFKDQPYANVRYQATLAGSYYPSPYDYRSYAWGLGVGFAFLLFCGVAVYLYRRRRVKPFQEVRFDEQA